MFMCGANTCINVFESAAVSKDAITTRCVHSCGSSVIGSLQLRSDLQNDTANPVRRFGFNRDECLCLSNSASTRTITGVAHDLLRATVLIFRPLKLRTV